MTPPGNDTCPPCRSSVCSPNGQHKMWPIVERKEQEQAGGVADAVDRKTGRPVPSRPRRHQRMRGRARQLDFSAASRRFRVSVNVKRRSPQRTRKDTKALSLESIVSIVSFVVSAFLEQRPFARSLIWRRI